MDDDHMSFRNLTSDFSRVWGIFLVWSAALWYMLWVNHSATGVPPPDMPNRSDGLWQIIVCVVICLLVIIVGYGGLWAERAAAARWWVGLRAILFLIPTVVFTCAFVIWAIMSLGLIPYQGLGYDKLYTSAVFAWHYFLWLAPDFAEYLFPIQSVMIHTNATTEMLAQMCRVAAVITLMGAVAPTLGRRH